MGCRQVNVLSSRCPHCSALLTRGADWCSLCLTDLRPVREPVVEATPEPQELEPVADLEAEALVVAVRPRGKHARRPEGALIEQEVIDAATASDAPIGLAASLSAIREATSREAQQSALPRGKRIDIDDIDLSVLAGAGSPSVINDWSLKAQTPGAKVGLMVAGVTVVGGIALLLLTLAGLVLR